MPKKRQSQSERLLVAMKAVESDPSKKFELYQIFKDSKVVFCIRNNIQSNSTQSDEQQANDLTSTEFASNSNIEQKERTIFDNYNIAYLHQVPDEGEIGETKTYLPVFSSVSIAKSRSKGLGLKDKSTVFRTVKGTIFFDLMLRTGRDAWLNPGGNNSRVLRINEIFESMRSVQTLPDGFEGNLSKQIGLLKVEYSNHINVKFKNFVQLHGLPSTLAATVELAENCLDLYLSFSSKIKDTAKTLPLAGDEKTIKMVWKMFLSLAYIYHIMHFRIHEFSSLVFTLETEVVLLKSENVSENVDVLPSDSTTQLLLTGLSERDLMLRFNVLEEERKLLVLDLEFARNESE
jgi:hypothetical protein